MLNIKYFLFVVIIGLYACSSSSETTKEEESVTLTTDYYKIDNTNLLLRIPSGWNEIDDNVNKIFDFWLVAPDKNSSIVFIPIRSEQKFATAKSTLNFLLDAGKSLKSNQEPEFSILNETGVYENNGITFGGFTYLTANKEKRSIIFGKGNTYYECLAYFKNNYQPTESEIKQLFEIQKLVLATLRIE